MPKELKELLERIAKLEEIKERNADQNKELTAAKERAETLKNEAQERADKNEKELNELKRKEAIREAGDQFGASADMIREFTGNPEKSVQDFKDALLASRMSETPSVPANVMSEDGRKGMLRAIEDSLVIRFGGSVKEPHADLDKFKGATLIDIARAVTGESSYNKEVIAERAMVSADFPNLLLNAGNRMLISEYEAQVATYRAFVTEVDVQDFRENTDITAGKGGRLDKLTESGELKEKQLGESAESWALESYGNKFVLTRKMIINDDLGAFTDMLSMFVEMAAQTANGIVYDLIMKRGDYASYTMSDSTAIFHADHSNLGAAALSATSLAAGRAAMRKHKSIDGKTPLNITPSYLIVGPDLEQTAYELVNSIAKVEDNKSSGVANFHNGSLEVVVDAEITGAQWFLSASRRAIKVGYLAGTGRRPLLKMNDSTLTKTEFEGVFDFGVVASDYRGLYAGNGVA